jgi:hypothetical protein
MASAKQSDLDRLHAIFTKELLRQLKEEHLDENGQRIPPSASLLSVVAKFLLSSGVKPTNDNPIMTQLYKTANLPFPEYDEHGIPVRNTKLVDLPFKPADKVN